MSVSFQVVGHSPQADHTREVPDGSTIRVTFAYGMIERVDILFPETGATDGAHEMDRDADRAGANAPETVAAENALEAPGNRAGRVNHAGPGESPGAKLDTPLPPGWRIGADGTRLSPRQEA